MTAGELRHRVMLQSPARSQNDAGETVVAPNDEIEVWAKIEELTGRDLERARAIVPTTTHRVTIRYRAGVSTDWTIVWKDRTLNVMSMSDRLLRHVWLEILCEEQGAHTS